MTRLLTSELWLDVHHLAKVTVKINMGSKNHRYGFSFRHLSSLSMPLGHLATILMSSLYPISSAQYLRISPLITEQSGEDISDPELSIKSSCSSFPFGTSCGRFTNMLILSMACLSEGKTFHCNSL